MNFINIIDESFSNKTRINSRIETNKEIISIEELIVLKVANELNNRSKFNSGAINVGQIGIQENFVTKISELDLEQSIYRALDGFQKNSFFIFVNDVQATELDEVILINSSTEITFIKLIPLIGG